MANSRGAISRSKPTLSSYTVEKLLKNEDGGFASVVADLGGSKDDKHLKHILLATVPHLFAFSDLPISIIEPVVNLIKSVGDGKKDQKRLLRALYYIIQVLLGMGKAGSTSAEQAGALVSAAAVEKINLKSAWAIFAKPSGDLAQQRVALRLMASIVRAMRQTSPEDRRSYSDHLAQTLSTILNKDFQVDNGHKGRRLFRSSTQKNADASKGLIYLQTVALSSARIAMSPGGKQRIAAKGFALLNSENPTAARHALALAAELAEKNPEDYMKAVGPHLEANFLHYADKGFLFPTSESSSGKAPPPPSGEVLPLNLSDVFSRVYLSRACGAVVHDTGLTKSRNTAFWKALVLLACNDSSELVFNEATKSMMGARTPRVIDLTAGGRQRKEFHVDQASEKIEKVMRWNAWGVVVKEQPSPLPGKDPDPKETILSRIVGRIRKATNSGSQPALCGACRSAVEIARARAYATSSNQKNAHKVNKASEIMDVLEEDLMVLATSSWHYSPALQSIALHALIWLQGSDGGSLTPPVLTSILSQSEAWTQELLSELLQTLFQRLVVEPEMAIYVLDSVNAIVAGNPSVIRPVEIVDFWSQAFEQANKTLVLRAALQFLEAPLPPRVLGGNGMDPVLLASATEAATSWKKLQRIATWWLGEASNFICEEFVGEEFSPILANAYGMDAPSILATEYMRNPLLATTISHLQQSLLTGQWGVRLAAAKSLMKIAFQSGEPFRIQIYKIFKEILLGIEEDAGMDPFGVVSVLQPVIDLLDAMYSGQAVVEGCINKWGGSLDTWPPEAEESLQKRHVELFSRVQSFAKIPDDAQYYPLGEKSRKLFLGEEIIDLNQSSQELLDIPSARVESNAQSSVLEDLSDDPSSPSESGPERHASLRMGAGVSLRHFATGSTARISTPPPPSAENSFSGFNVQPQQSVPEESDESESPNAQVQSPTEEDAFGDWGLYDGTGAEDPAFITQKSTVSSIVSLEREDEDNEAASEDDVGTETKDDNFMEDSGTASPYGQTSARKFEPKDASVMYDFVAELEGELTVVAGDVIQILEEREGGWYWVRLGDKEGLVPCAYVAEPDM